MQLIVGVVIGVFVGAGAVFGLALCKAAGDADRAMEAARDE